MASRVLVINAGSSSLKFKLFDVVGSSLRASISGLLEQIGHVENSRMTTKRLDGEGNGRKDEKKVAIPNYTVGLDLLLSHLQETCSSSIASEVRAVGHRVVHGKAISRPVLIGAGVKEAIRQAAQLAPLHNPANLEGIEAATKIFSGCPQVAVFDTAFHQTMPPHASTYALPLALATAHGIRRYGFHGTSYMYLVREAARMMGRPASDLNIIACHIGAGASMCAIQGGECIDTSMGMTPLEGLVMATRCGDIDPAVLLYLQDHLGMTSAQLDKLLNKQSGLVGLAGSGDLRTVTENAARGEERAKLALEVYAHRLRKYLGAYWVHLGAKVDAIVFSAGVGENSALMRRMALQGLEGMGIHLDDSQNEAMVGGKAGSISPPDSPVSLLVIPTDEELSIAQQAWELVQQQPQ